MRVYVASSFAFLTGFLVFIFLLDLLSGGQNASGLLLILVAVSFAAFIKADKACSGDERRRYEAVLKMPFEHLQEGWPIYVFLFMVLLFGYEIYHDITHP